MPRLTTRLKRKFNLTTSRKHRFWKGTTTRKKRMKSFPTKERAEAWAQEQGLDTSTHYLHALKRKFQWRKR